MRFLLTFVILGTEFAYCMPAWAQRRPFTREQVNNMVRDGCGEESGAKLIGQRGVDFIPKVEKPTTVDPAAEVRRAEVQQDAAPRAEFMQNMRFANAEEEYRAAVRLDPQNADYKQNYERLLQQVKK